MAITSALCTSFKKELLERKHDFNATSGHSFKIALYTSAASLDAATTVYSTSNEVVGTGYTAGGTDTQNGYTETAGTASMTGVDVVWTAGAADWNTFRYVVLYNDTQTSPADPLIAWWDYGSGLVLGNGETFTVDFGSSIFTLA